MAECQHEWDDLRAVSSDAVRPPPDQDFVECKKCGAPIQLARRPGIWLNPTDPRRDGPPWAYGPAAPAIRKVKGVAPSPSGVDETGDGDGE